MKGAFWVMLALLVVSVAANVWQCREIRAAKDGCYFDTIRLTDTVVVREPVVRESVVIRTETRFMKLADTLCVVFRDTVRDSVMVEVPIEQKVYADTNYVAWISGFEPRLDSIQVYRHEMITRPGSKRWGIGVQAGYGLTTRGFAPFVGVGVSYRLGQ